jgi:hypothetical protein
MFVVGVTLMVTKPNIVPSAPAEQLEPADD